MRIGIDVRTADPSEPGQQRYLWRLGEWLGAAGHAVHYLTVREQPTDVVAPKGTVLERCDGLSRSALRGRVTALELDALLLNPERSRRYRGVPANVLRAGYGTEHYSQKLRSFRRGSERLARRLLRAAPWNVAERRWERAFYEAPQPPPRVVAQSRYMRDEILSSYRIDAERVHVVHNAVDLDEFSVERRQALREEMRGRWNVPDDAICLLFLGHNFRLKGLWQLLRVLHGAPSRVHLLVVGRGTGGGQRRKAHRLVERYGLTDRVTLTGPVRPSLHALAASDALVHLSWHDSFGFVVLEAMACGLPVVTTRWVGAAELLEDGASGLIVDPARDASIGDAIDALTAPALRERLGAAAARAARAHDEPSNFARILDVVRKAAEERDGPIRA